MKTQRETFVIKQKKINFNSIIHSIFEISITTCQQIITGFNDEDKILTGLFTNTANEVPSPFMYE